MRSIQFLLVFLFFTLAGCVTQQPVTKDISSSFPLPLPVTFTGQLDTDGCSRLDITLNLREAGLYQLRTTCIDTSDRPGYSSIGYWKYDPVNRIIVFGQNRKSLKTMLLIDGKTLRLTDAGDVELDINTVYELHLSDTLDPFHDTVAMQGMFSIEKNAAYFIECRSGFKFPVAAEKDYTQLVERYNSTPHGQNEPILVTLAGSLQLRPDRSKNDLVETVIVEKFNGIFPNQDCEGKARQVDLFNTTWKLIELDGKKVTIEPGKREPFIVLESEGNRMHGFSGCNRFMGTYLVKGDIFVFNKMASTRMACLKGLELESIFLEAMRKTEAYRIVDNTLELRDRHEKVLARLQEVK